MKLRTPGAGRLALAAAVTAALVSGLVTAPASADVATDDLVLHYLLDETEGTVAHDASGNGNDGEIRGHAELTGAGGVRLNYGTTNLQPANATGDIKLPDDIIAGLESITVSLEVLVDSSQTGAYFLYGLGNRGASGEQWGDGYVFATGSPLRAGIATGNWSTEQQANSGSNLPRDVWTTVTYTLDADTDTARLYLNGTQVAQNTAVTHRPADIGGGTTTFNHIGRSNYAGDNLLRGALRDFRIYDVALSAEQVAELAPTTEDLLQRDAEALTLGDTSAVTSDLTLPATGASGATISWESSSTAVVAADGTVTRPAPGESDAVVTLTATLTLNGLTQTRTFEVTVLAELDEQAILDQAVADLTVTNIDDVRGNLHLPTSVAVDSGEVTVAWATSDASVVTTDGIVTRQASDTEVTLTATLSYAGLSETKAFAAQVRAAVELDELEGYVFTYFTGNSLSGENIYLARSDGNDALNWHELNNGQPVLTSDQGTGGLRDPFIIRSPEGDIFYLIATDLSIGSGTGWGDAVRHGSQYIEVWESTDLVNWSEQRHVKVAPDNAGNTWAPEAYYDESIGAYIVFWASSLYSTPGHTDSSYHRMMYATTRDFVTFSEAQVWQDTPGLPRIDTTVIKEGDTYYRFTKDEGSSASGCTDIMQERSTSLRGQMEEWTLQADCIGSGAGTSALEGPSVFKSNPGDVNNVDGEQKYYLFVDEYGGRGFLPLETDDLDDPNWQISASYDLPSSPRHGTVMPITAAEWEALEAYAEPGEPGPDPLEPNEDGELLRYTFEDGSGTQVTDVSGGGNHGTIVGSTDWNDGSLTFNGSTTYVDLPDNLLAGVTDITIEAEVLVHPQLGGDYFFYGLGNTTNGIGDGYLFSSDGRSNYRASIATGNWSTEQTVSQGQALPRDTWAHLVYTLSGGTATIYLDGVAVGTNTNVTHRPGDIGDGYTTANYIGRSQYDADNLFRGQFAEFAIYNRALSADEVLVLSGATGVLTDFSLSDAEVLKVAPIVDSQDRTVVFPVLPGTDLTQLAPVFRSFGDATVSPASGTVVDLSSPVEYTVSDEGGETVWTLRAVEMNSPVLPGLYADPNIVVFGGTYYIYATSDGYAGWGGKEFYVWKSYDLVTWERSEEPFLTLDGADGNVPWAEGNAWAPTIIERDGKYYFYFSGHYDPLNRKVIGVAVADHPEGPFVAEPTPMIYNQSSEGATSGQAIDPAAFHDPVSGKWYLFWGNGSPVYAELADDMVSLAGPVQAMSGLTGYREGTFVNYREDAEGDGTYHLTYSIDDTGSENYRVGYATATSIDGPWTYRGVILEKDPSLGILGTGHNSVLNVPGTDDWYIAYHRFAIPGGNGNNRETTIDRIEIDPQTGLFTTITPTLESVTAQEIADDNPLAVSIDGVAKVGETLSIELNEPWEATGTQWYRDGQEIAGATGTELELTADDEDARIGVTLTGEKDLWRPAEASAEVGPVVGPDEEPVAEVRVTVTGAVEGESGWRQGAVTVSLQLADGVEGSVEYALGEGDWTAYTAPVAIDGNGVTLLRYRAVVGGEPVADSQGEITLRIDVTPPVSTAAVEQADAYSPATLVVEAADAHSGVASIEHRIGDGAWLEVPSGGIVFDGVGSWVVSYRATDVAGNVETARTITVSVIDEEAPEATLTVSPSRVRAGESVEVAGEGFEPGEGVTVTLHSDPVLLGVLVADDDGAIQGTVTIPLSTETGDHLVEAVGQDSGIAGSAALTVLPAADDGETPTPGETDTPTPGETDTPTPGESPSPGTSPTPGGKLEETGAGGALTAMLLTALLLVAGAGALAVRRRHTA